LHNKSIGIRLSFDEMNSLKDALAGMNDADLRVRAAAAGLLDHWADQSYVGPLTKALGDPSARVRRNAVHALGCQACKPAPLAVDSIGLLIEKALSDSSIRVRRVSVHQIGLQQRDPRAVAALETILARDTDAGLRSRAEFALKNQCGRV
jgi:HEAT repeat protein